MCSFYKMRKVNEIENYNILCDSLGLFSSYLDSMIQQQKLCTMATLGTHSVTKETTTC